MVNTGWMVRFHTNINTPELRYCVHRCYAIAVLFCYIQHDAHISYTNICNIDIDTGMLYLQHYKDWQLGGTWFKGCGWHYVWGWG